MRGIVRFLIWAISLSVIAGLLYIGAIGFHFYRIFNPAHDDVTWRQKMTVTVDTPNGPVSGSSVVQIYVRVITGNTRDTGMGTTAGLVGEAVAIEVSPGRWLYVALGPEPGLYYRAAKDRIDGTRMSQWAYEIPEQTEAVALDPTWLGKFVTFSDIQAPRTAQLVDKDDLAATFGQGYSLSEVTLEIVDDPISDGQLGPLGGWLGDYATTQLDGVRYRGGEPDYPVANSLNSLDFKRLPP